MTNNANRVTLGMGFCEGKVIEGENELPLKIVKHVDIKLKLKGKQVDD